MAYTLNGIDIYTTYGIRAGHALGSNIAMRGVYDMPKRTGTTFKDWGDSDGVEPWTNAGEMMFAGRDITFTGFVVGADVALNAAVSGFYDAIDSATGISVFETPYNSASGYVKSVIPRYMNGGCTLEMTFREPVVALTGTLPATGAGAYTIDSIPFSSFGLYLTRPDQLHNLPENKEQFFTQYGQEGYQIVKRKNKTLEMNGFVMGSSLSDFTGKVQALYKVFSSAGTRTIVLNTITTVECFATEGFKIENVHYHNNGVIARFHINLMIKSVTFSSDWVSFWATRDWESLEIQKLTPLCSADALINQAQPTFNYGATAVFAVGEYNSATTLTRSVLKFDLSSVPENAIILNAKLSICRSSDLSDNARTLRVYRLKKAFTEGSKNGAAPADGVTWNTRNGTDNWTTAGAFDAADCEQTEIGSIALAASEGYQIYKHITLNVTSLAELDLGYGFLLKVDTENNDAHTYYHKGDATYKPYLTIRYYLPLTESPLLTKYASNPLIVGAFGSIVYEGINQYSFYYGKPNGTLIYRRTSTDGLTWGAEVTLDDLYGGIGTITDVATAWKEGNTWYMLYRSNEWGGDRSIGLATSANGLNWTKEATNPVITHADIGAWCTGDIDPWGIIKIGATYYLWVNDVGEVPRQSGLMTSTDLINWTPDANNPIFGNGRYCGMPIKYGSNYYIFMCYTPEGNVTGANPWAYRVELYRDSDPRFLAASREYLGVILFGGEDGEWDDDYLDTTSIITETIQRDTFPLGTAEDGKLWMYYAGHSGSVWGSGLATGHLEMLDKLTAITEPDAGE